MNAVNAYTTIVDFALTTSWIFTNTSRVQPRAFQIVVAGVIGCLKCIEYHQVDPIIIFCAAYLNVHYVHIVSVLKLVSLKQRLFRLLFKRYTACCKNKVETNNSQEDFSSPKNGSCYAYKVHILV